MISGIKFHYLKGDNATMAVMPIAHKAALECDVIYSVRFALTANSIKNQFSGSGANSRGIQIPENMLNHC